MRVKPYLIVWQYRRMLGVNLAAAVTAATLALLTPGRLMAPFSAITGWLIILALLHSLAMVFVQGRVSGSSGAYLYTRGFTRDALWAHQMLASVAGALTVVMALGLVVWTPLRATWQDVVNQSPYYPGAARFEWGVPLLVLPAYALILPVLHYVWIRLAQPTRGRAAGILLAAWLVPGFFIALNIESRSVGLINSQSIAFAAWGVVSSLLLFKGWRLHRNVEVGR